MGELFAQYGAMPLLLQIFWGCAVVASLIFLVQMVLTLIGMDSSDMDVDFDGANTMDLGGGLNLFTIKNFIGFLVGFGWAGVCFYNSITSSVLLILVAVIVGLLFVGIFVVIYKQTKKLEHNGAFQIDEVKGTTVSVYLRIPAQGSGKGKVQVSQNGSVHELDALTDGEEIPSGAKVKVVEIVDNETVKVVHNS
ncbi:MAG: NfeD family protein [Bacteroidaceae bacterium]|nr:NfeD family protein [Bacteroidaceae bacterium]